MQPFQPLTTFYLPSGYVYSTFLVGKPRRQPSRDDLPQFVPRIRERNHSKRTPNQKGLLTAAPRRVAFACQNGIWNEEELDEEEAAAVKKSLRHKEGKVALGASIYDVRTREGGGGSPKSRRKEQKIFGHHIGKPPYHSFASFSEVEVRVSCYTFVWSFVPC